MSLQGSTVFSKDLNRVLFVLLSVIILIVGVYWFYSRLLFNGATHNTPGISGSSSAVKLSVDATGIYEIEMGKIQEAGFGKQITDPKKMRLFYLGQEQPFWLEHTGKDTYVQFFAQSSSSLYTNKNIYWLVADEHIDQELGWQNNAHAVSNQAGMVEYPVKYPTFENLSRGSYYAVEHQEQNKVYQPLVEGGDHWFWQTLPAPKSVSYEFSLTTLSFGEALLRFCVWSGTEANVNPDHHLKISINGKDVSDEFWDGKGIHLLEKEITNQILQEGINTITVSAPGVEGVIADIVNINWFDIVYPRKPVAVNDRLYFTATGSELHLSGFSGPIKIFDVTDRMKPELIEVKPVNNLISAYSFTGEEKHNYIAVGPNGYYPPGEVRLAKLSPNLRSQNYHNGYIAIGAEDLLEPLVPLLSWRSNQGYPTLSIPFEAVYDQFNFGLPEPLAIQSFVNYVMNEWPDSLKFILLVGDASYDPRGYISSTEANRLPTFLVQTSFGGETASDVLFVVKDVSSNQRDAPIALWPNLAIGRIPARNPDQVKTVVQKTLLYEEKSSKTTSPLNIVAIADGQSDTFKYDAQKFLDLFPVAYNRELFAPPAGVTDANLKILDFFNRDTFLIAYFGHGSINLWGKDRLFSIDDVERMKSVDHFPVVINMSCLTGLFTHPKVDSLAEALLWQKDSGAIAVLAPTSLTLPYDQSYLSDAIVTQLTSGKDLTLGQILQNARLEVPSTEPSSQDVLLTFLLFGDPALHLIVNSNK
jgi:hypothetical protein